MALKDRFKAIPRKWRTPRTILYLFALELLIEIAALALFGIAQPDLYRTRLWQEGSNHGWNSNPNSIIYAYANYRPISTPLPWSQFVTNFNVIISVVALFVLLCKGIMYICHIFYPLLSVFIHAALIALFAVSAHAQAAPDMSDPEHPQPGAPWYITKSCGAPVRAKLKGYCEQAKGSFAVTIILLALFLTYFILSFYSLIPSRSSKLSTCSDTESQQQRPWEMAEVPPTPGTTGGLKSPMTPRTTAFNTLSGKMGGAGGPKGKGKEKVKEKGKGKGKGKGKEPVRGPDGKLPLRHHISMGDETYQSPAGEAVMR
ncbi:MAG: hypothetical protein LQ343_004000 [Gyalolechia ehrenbergii]|nr:MAG: hypothetical protein LQ343_004000 [Gyalolechia ehrenbergii]